MITNRRKFMSMAGVFGAAALVPSSWLHAVEPHVHTEPYNTFTEEEEIALGRKFAESYESKIEILHNSTIDSYLAGMVHRLANASQKPEWPFQVKVVNSAVINASAIPGGHLYVERGLLDFVEDENEVAGAVAHEIGHVVGRHTTNQLAANFLARGLYETVKKNVLRNNQVISQIIETLGGPVVMLAELKYNRDHESEADMLGFYEMLRAGWHPDGLMRFFQRLSQRERSSVIGVMLSDHPASTERASAIRREEATARINAPSVLQTAEFRQMKEVLRQLPPAPKPHKQ
jgi:predicted Zn-dependent protease